MYMHTRAPLHALASNTLCAPGRMRARQCAGVQVAGATLPKIRPAIKKSIAAFSAQRLSTLPKCHSQSRIHYVRMWLHSMVHTEATMEECAPRDIPDDKPQAADGDADDADAADSGRGNVAPLATQTDAHAHDTTTPNDVRPARGGGSDSSARTTQSMGSRTADAPSRRAVACQMSAEAFAAALMNKKFSSMAPHSAT